MAVPGSGPRIPPAEKLELFFEEIAGGECCGARIFFAEFGCRPVIGRDLQQECRIGLPHVLIGINVPRTRSRDGSIQTVGMTIYQSLRGVLRFVSRFSGSCGFL